MESVTAGILRQIEEYLNYANEGYFLSEGIIEAYKSLRSSRSSDNSILAGLTAVAEKGQVIPGSLFCDVAEIFSNAPPEEDDFELSRDFKLDKISVAFLRAFLKNQSLPDQWLTRIWEFLRKTKRPLKSEGSVESFLIILCTSYLLNRNLPPSPENHESSNSTMLKPSPKENLIFFLFGKFFTKEASKDVTLRGTTDLLLRANELAQKNTAQASTAGPKASTSANVTEEELREFQKSMACRAMAGYGYIFWNLDFQRRFIQSLRSNSAIRKLLKNMLGDPYSYSTRVRHNIEFPEMLYFARVAFISMVTSGTKKAAQDCGEILELICTKYGRRDLRLKTVVAQLGRMRKLGIASFKCVNSLPKKLNQITSRTPSSTVLNKLEKNDTVDEIISLAGFFNPVLDSVLESTKDAKKWMEQASDPKESYLRRGDLVEEILLAAHKKDFCKSSVNAAKAPGGDMEMWFKICANLAHFKYKCPTSLLMKCIHEHVIAAPTVASLSLESRRRDEHKAALIERTVYRSVIFSLTKTIRSKIPAQDSSTDFLTQSEESVMVLAAELLEALNNNLPKLNSFLSKFSTVKVPRFPGGQTRTHLYGSYFVSFRCENLAEELGALS